MYFDSKEIEQILQEVVDKFLIPKFHELEMNASGEWVQNVEVEAEGDNGVIKARYYTEYLTKGRPPSEKLPPISAIKKWVMAKFGKSDKEAESMAWAVAYKIKKEGTKWHTEDGSELVTVLESQQVVDYIQDRMAGLLRVKVAEELKRQAIEVFKN